MPRPVFCGARYYYGKILLICNPHLDPVGMWDWEEDLGESISTFHQAEEGYILRLVNNNAELSETDLTLCGQNYWPSYGNYEVRTYFHDGNALTVKEYWV